MIARYIDAEQAISLIKNDSLYQVYYSKSDAINCINATPAADVVEIRHGKWLTDRFGMERAICSICGAVYEGGDSFRFCPECGAKMDLED